MKLRYVLFLFVLAGAQALFAGGVGGGLPWEGPLATIATSFAGPTAASICTILIALAGIMLMAHNDFHAFGIKVSHLVLAGGFAMLAGVIMTRLYGVAGAVV